MSFLEHLNLLRRIDALIRRKATGNYIQLSKKLGVSQASIYRYLDDLRSLGAPVVYCRLRQSFYYSEPYELKIY
ncbi:MAG: HTH domain-containing protein [Saprospiraceae bacterium]